MRSESNLEICLLGSVGMLNAGNFCQAAGDDKNIEGEVAGLLLIDEKKKGTQQHWQSACAARETGSDGRFLQLRRHRVQQGRLDGWLAQVWLSPLPAKLHRMRAPPIGIHRTILDQADTRHSAASTVTDNK